MYDIQALMHTLVAVHTLRAPSLGPLITSNLTGLDRSIGSSEATRRDHANTAENERARAEDETSITYSGATLVRKPLQRVHVW